MRRPLILVLNPGSTSTKLAIFRGPRLESEWTHWHLDEKDDFSKPMERIATDRVPDILGDVQDKGYQSGDIDLVVARGGLLKPLKGGVYRVNEKMVRDLADCAYGRHASNLGAIMAWKIAGEPGKKSFIVNPVVVDELSPVAKVSGHPEITRKSIFHALNQKAVAEKVCKKIGKPYNKARLIVVHAGGGVSVGAHLRGRVIDVNNALEGEGTFTPERTGGLPLLDFLRYINDKGLNFKQAQALVSKNSGIQAYLGTRDCREIEKRIRNGDSRARLIYRAFAYQVAKDIGALAASVFKGRLDAIVLTGGIAGGAMFRSWLREHVSFIAPVYVYPKTSEMEALAAGAWQAWTNKVRPATYR
jgi:butyrate kinase